MIGPLPTTPGGFNRVLVAIDKFTKWIEVKPVSCIATDYPTASSQTWAPTSTITSSGSTARTAGSTSYMFQSPILGPMDKSSALDALKKRLHDAANSKGGKWIKELPNAL
jgi:hypothetical protein